MSTESDLSRQASNWDNMYNFQNLTMGSCAQNEAQRQNITVPFLEHFFLKGMQLVGVAKYKHLFLINGTEKLV